MSRKLIAALLTLIFLLAGCAPAATPAPTVVPTAAPTVVPTLEITPTSAAITLTDSLGRKVTLTGPAQRVVSLAPSNTEILFVVGAGAQVVGRDETSSYPPESQSLPTVGGYSGFNTEAIVALHPDLVLAGGINTPELVSSLEQLGLTVYYIGNPTTIEEMYTNLEIVAALTGHQADAAALIDSLKARVAAVDAKVATAATRPTVFYEFDATDPTKPYTYGPGSFGDLLIQRAGGTNVGATLSTAYPQISLEQLVVDNPSRIIRGESNSGVTPDSVKARPGWEGLGAVKNGQIFPFNDDLVSRPGPRLVDGLEALARLIHPELFK